MAASTIGTAFSSTDSINKQFEYDKKSQLAMRRFKTPAYKYTDMEHLSNSCRTLKENK